MSENKETLNCKSTISCRATAALKSEVEQELQENTEADIDSLLEEQEKEKDDSKDTEN